MNEAFGRSLTLDETKTGNVVSDKPCWIKYASNSSKHHERLLVLATRQDKVVLNQMLEEFLGRRRERRPLSVQLQKTEMTFRFSTILKIC
jgi:hypothetical protein